MRGGRPSFITSNPTMIRKPHQHSYNQEDHRVMGGGGSGGSWGLSWPPRFYTCNFCKREFRSAQALGGHMNVHRRDRARLRQSPISNVTSSPSASHLNLNLIPDPNPNPNLTKPTLSSSSVNFGRHISRYVPLAYPSFPSQCAIFDPRNLMVTRRKNNLRGKSSKGGGSRVGVGIDPRCERNQSKGGKLARFDMEIDIFDNDVDGADGADGGPVGGLDLELRLGYNR